MRLRSSPKTARPTPLRSGATWFALLVPVMAVTFPAIAQRGAPPAPGTKPGQAPASPAAAPPPLLLDTVRAILPESEQAKVRSVVEDIVGRKLTREVPIQIVEPRQMAEAILRSMKATSPNREFDPRQVGQLSLRQIALYDVGSRQIYVGSGGLASVGDSERGPIARMLLAQATVNAIIDQELSTPEFMKGDGPEVAVARRMLSEGFAVTARDRAAVAMGLDPNSAAYRALLPGSFDPADERSSLERTIYGTGRTVVESRWNADGLDAAWKLLASKPATVRELAALIPRSRAIRVLQSVMDTQLPRQTWDRARAPSAPSVAFAALNGPNAVMRQALAVGCLGVDTLGYSNRQGGGAVLFSALRGKDEASTARIAEAIRRMPSFLRADFDRQHTQVTFSESTSEVNGVSVRITSIESAKEGDSVPPTRIIDMVVGNEVMSITLTNATMSKSTLDKAIQVATQELGRPAEFVSATDAPPSAPSIPAPDAPASGSEGRAL